MDSKKKIDMRCGSCGKLLARTDGNTEIVCPRCGAMNVLDPKTEHVECKVRENKRPRNTFPGAYR